MPTAVHIVIFIFPGVEEVVFRLSGIYRRHSCKLHVPHTNINRGNIIFMGKVRVRKTFFYWHGRVVIFTLILDDRGASKLKIDST